MKRFITLFLVVVSLNSFGQGYSSSVALNQEVFVQFDRDFYLSGDKVWFSLFNYGSTTLRPLSETRFMQFTVLNRSGEKIIQERIKVEKGRSKGQFILPLSLPTDEYLVHIGFAGEAADQFMFRTKLGIYNRQEAIETANSSSLDFSSPENITLQSLNENISLKGAKTTFGFKEKVELNLGLVNADNANISILVRPHSADIDHIKAEPLNSFEKQNYRAFKTLNFQTLADHNALQYQLVRKSPVTEGLRTSIYVPETKQLKGFFKVNNDIYTMDMSNLPGGIKSFYFSEFSYKAYIPPNAAWDYEKDLFKDNLVPYFENEPSFSWAESDPDFGSVLKDVTFLTPAYTPHVLKYTWQQSIIASVLTSGSYESIPTNTPLLDTDAMMDIPLFYKKASDYEVMDNMAEFLYEIVTGIRTFEKDGKQDVRVAFVGGVYQDAPLFLVNGIPTRDTETVLKIPIDDVIGAGVIKDHKASGLVKYNREVRPFGDFGGSGIVVIHLKPGATNPFRISYSEMLKRNTYIVPEIYPNADYSQTSGASNIPDFRQTLYWNPEMKLDADTTQLSFYTSDIEGNYEVIVQGVSENGKIIYARYPFKVEKKMQQN
uniref:hypothetical protein n=1 Tax=Roseivirga sp. TaxID=1964215 RepID=UPI0040483393